MILFMELHKHLMKHIIGPDITNIPKNSSKESHDKFSFSADFKGPMSEVSVVNERVASHYNSCHYKGDE